MFAFRLIYVCSSALEWLGEGPLLESDSNTGGAKTRPVFESPSRSLLKSGMQQLHKYGIRQETISGRPKLMYSPSDTWLGEGPLFKSVSNKCRGGGKLQLLFKSFLGPLLNSGMGALGQI